MLDELRLIRHFGIRSRRRWQGHIDQVSKKIISGWAADRLNPDAELKVIARGSSGRCIETVANIFREDLQKAGYGHGRHGFLIDISGWSVEDGEIEVVISGVNQRINSSRFNVDGFIARGRGVATVRDSATRWAGHIDSADRASIVGWAADLHQKERLLEVEVVSGSGKRIRTLASSYREDLLDAGYGNGCHGFLVEISAFGETDYPIDVFICGSKYKINPNPIDFDLYNLIRSATRQHNIKLLLTTLILAVTHTFRSLPNVRPGEEHSRVSSRQTEKLLQAAFPVEDPSGLVSNFIHYESVRLDRDRARKGVFAGALPDQMQLIMWYLVHYVRHRQSKYHLPLSASQQSYLNSPIPLAGYSSAVSIVFYNFVHSERTDLRCLDDIAVLRSALYWWCCERLPVDRLDGVFTTKEMVSVLCQPAQWLDEPFPFNYFMIEYFNRHVELHCLDMSKIVDRGVFFLYLIIKSFSDVYIARFLPRETLRNVLLQKSGEPNFERALKDVFVSAGVDGSKFRRDGETLLASVGISLRQPWTNNPRDTGECFMPRRNLEQPCEEGVALIGPIHKASGLGQACRMSFAALSDCEAIAPTTLVFDIDNPAPVGFASHVEGPEYCKRRHINLIHLNAESVPLAFAYEQQEIFAESYNIGYFFWELNVIPKCHQLALDLLDEIWVSSEYNREIYSRYTTKPVVNVGMAVEAPPQVQALDRRQFGIDPSAYVFLATFDSFSFIERKNPLGVIEAFQEAFPPGGNTVVQLVLKTQNRFRVSDPHQLDLWKQIDLASANDLRIIVLNETLSYRDLIALKLTCDCYVSLHRSEGWGFGMLEAMSLARPVIATAYSGNMEFCRSDNCFLVDFDLIGVQEAEYIFVERGSLWAQPRRSHAAERMREVAADPAAARAIGKAGADFINSNFTVQEVARRYGSRLAQIRAQQGGRLDCVGLD